MKLRWSAPLVAMVLGLAAPVAHAASKSLELGLTFGNLSGSKSKGEPGTDISFSVQTVGLFLFGPFAVGPAFSYSRYFELGDEDESYSYWNMSIGPRAKFYFSDLNGAFAPYASAQLMTGQGASSGFGNDEDTTNSVAAGGGMVFFLGANAALDLELSYKVEFRKTEYDNDDDDIASNQDDSTNRDADTGLTAWFSVFL